MTSSELAARCERTANVQRATGSEVRPRPRARRYRGERLCCAKIPFSFEVDRYNEQPANNRLTFIYALLPEKGAARNRWTRSLRMFSGIRGRPACDFPFQNNLKPLRCQPIRISGLTMTKASFQSQRRDQKDKRETGGVVQSSWLDLSLLIEGQLLSQKQDFRAEGCARAEQETEEKKPFRDQIGDQDKQRIQ